MKKMNKVYLLVVFIVATLFITILSSCKTSKHAGCDAYGQKSNNEDSSIVKSLDILSDSAKSWPKEQKQEFAKVFFIEKGQFTVPKEPIILCESVDSLIFK